MKQHHHSTNSIIHTGSNIGVNSSSLRYELWTPNWIASIRELTHSRYWLRFHGSQAQAGECATEQSPWTTLHTTLLPRGQSPAATRPARTRSLTAWANACSPWSCGHPHWCKTTELHYSCLYTPIPQFLHSRRWSFHLSSSTLSSSNPKPFKTSANSLCSWLQTLSHVVAWIIKLRSQPWLRQSAASLALDNCESAMGDSTSKRFRICLCSTWSWALPEWVELGLQETKREIIAPTRGPIPALHSHAFTHSVLCFIFFLYVGLLHCKVEVNRPTLYFGPDWGLARALKIWINKIARFHQIQSKGFILGMGPNTQSSHVMS